MNKYGSPNQPSWPSADAAFFENSSAPWDRLFAGWHEALSADDAARLQRHIERLRTAIGSAHVRRRPMENQTGPRSPHLLLIAEPNGSGKTTVTRRMVGLSSFPKARVIDPDALAAALPGNFCKAGNAGRAALVAGRLRYRALADRQDILWQAVFAARGDATRFARAAKNAGYVTHLIFKLPRATRPSTPIAWLGAIWRAGTPSLWTSALIAIIALWATCHDRSGTSILRASWTIRLTARPLRCNAR